ncbi:MAG TPA: Gfo/Idh/MocA family oxidoreductase [Armatimonadetes bacterium]|nr:Gfo/Idh/MocA family oxidoreductase [Armatimonadota bacterium]
MAERLKIGVVGTGNIFEGWGGGSGHLPGLAWVVDEAQVVALCDVSEPALRRAEKALKKYFAEKAKECEERGFEEVAELLRSDAESVRLYTSLDEMLDRESLDILDVLTPAEHHKEAVLKALEAGCHVMCEKPLTRTWPEAREIEEAVEGSGKLLQYNEHLVFADPYVQMRRLVQEGAIGEPLCLFLSFCTGFGPGSYGYVKGRVGALLDMGSHAVVLAWFLLGFDLKPVRVWSLPPVGVSTKVRQVLVEGVPKEMPVDDDAHFAVEFEHPGTGRHAIAYIEVSWATKDFHGTRVIGTQGEMRPKGAEAIEVIDVHGSAREARIGHSGWLRFLPPPGYSGHPQEIKAMVRCVKEGTKPLCDHKIAAESIALLNACQLSEAKGRVAVSLEEFKGFAKELWEKTGADPLAFLSAICNPSAG